MDQVRNEITERATPGESQARMMTPTQSPWANRHHWWARLRAQQATFDGTASVHGARAALHGLALGADRTFKIAVRSGYHVVRVVVDGNSVGAVTSFTFTNVTANHTISVTFAPNYSGDDHESDRSRLHSHDD